MNKLKAMVVSGLLVAAGVAGCSGGGSSTGNGNLSILMTDAPVDNATEIWVQFTGVTVKPQNGEQMEFIFDAPRDIDMLTLMNGTTEALLPTTGVPAGSYNWIRLAVNAQFDGSYDSYVMLDTGEKYELQIPSGSQTGLKLVSGFTVMQGQSTNMVIDWDMRKALVNPMGRPGMGGMPGYFLRPAMRVTDMAQYGTLRGTVADTLVPVDTCTGPAVYLYQGSGVTPGDIGDATTEPLTTATVSQNDAGAYVYSVHYLAIGDYTAAFTCDADADVADTDEDAATVEFTETASVTINDGAVTVQDFPVAN